MNKTLYDESLRRMKEVHDIAVGIYGEENVDMIGDPPKKLKDLEYKVDSAGRFENGVGGDEVYTLIIFFKELDITNNRRNKHKLLNTYFLMKFRADLVLGPTYLYRSLRTLDEYNSGYIYSHTPSSPGPNLGGLCYGHSSESDLARIQNIMMGSYGEEEIIMFISSIKSYLEWESTDTSPFARISSIKTNNNYNSYSNPVPNISEEAFLQNIRLCDPEVLINEQFNVSFSDKDILWARISDKFDNSFKMDHDPFTKKTIQNNRSLSRDEVINQLNERYKNYKINFKFKGNSVGFSIVKEEEDKKEEDKNKYVKLIPRNYFNMYISRLEERIKNELKKKVYEELQIRFNNKENLSLSERIKI